MVQRLHCSQWAHSERPACKLSPRSSRQGDEPAQSSQHALAHGAVQPGCSIRLGAAAPVGNWVHSWRPTHDSKHDQQFLCELLLPSSFSPPVHALPRCSIHCLGCYILGRSA